MTIKEMLILCDGYEVDDGICMVHVWYICEKHIPWLKAFVHRGFRPLMVYGICFSITDPTPSPSCVPLVASVTLRDAERKGGGCILMHVLHKHTQKSGGGSLPGVKGAFSRTKRVV